VDRFCTLIFNLANEHFKFILPSDKALRLYIDGLKNFDKYNDMERLTIKTEK